MKRRIVPLMLALAMMLVLVAIPASAARFSVKATASNEWGPDFRHIEPGDRIVWKNPTEATHNIIGYGKNWSLEKALYSGDTFSKRFNKKGVYKYRCSIHSAKQDGQCEGMCGVIHVERY